MADRLPDALPEVPLSRKVMARVADIYADDYARFDYPIDPDDTTKDT